MLVNSELGDRLSAVQCWAQLTEARTSEKRNSMFEISPLILTNSFVALTVVLVVWLVTYATLVKLFPIGELGWKRVDYFWLTVATLGLLPITAEVRHSIRQAQLPSAERYLERAYRDVSARVNTGFPVCFDFIRGEYSPVNFDQFQAEHDAFCEWSHDFLSAIPPFSKAEYPAIEMSNLPEPPETSVTVLLDYVKRVRDAVSDYQRERVAIATMRAELHRGELAKFVRLISPLFIAIALGVRLAKVGGEIALKNRDDPPTA